MLKNKCAILSSLFSILVSSSGIIFLNKTFAEAKRVDKKFQELITNTEKESSFPPLTVIVPARNEESTIRDCLEAILDQDYPDFEVIVIDDASTDNTPSILSELVSSHKKKVKLVNATSPGKEWLGKPNALWQGYQKANTRAQWILFVDADVRLLPNVLKGSVAYARANQLDMLSMAPGLESHNVSFWHKLLSGEVAKLYTLAYINPLKPPKKGSVDEASAIGTFILVKRTAYDTVGTHNTVKNSIIEDIMLARSFREKGFITSQILGFNYLKTKGYRSFKELWEGINKNFFTVAHKNWIIITWLVVVEFICGILPVIKLIKNLLSETNEFQKKKISFVLNILSLILLYLSTNELNRQNKVSWAYALLFPFSITISSVMVLVSACRGQFLKKVNWKGRYIDL